MVRGTTRRSPPPGQVRLLPAIATSALMRAAQCGQRNRIDGALIVLSSGLGSRSATILKGLPLNRRSAEGFRVSETSNPMAPRKLPSFHRHAPSERRSALMETHRGKAVDSFLPSVSGRETKEEQSAQCVTIARGAKNGFHPSS